MSENMFFFLIGNFEQMFVFMKKAGTAYNEIVVINENLTFEETTFVNRAIFFVSDIGRTLAAKLVYTGFAVYDGIE